MRLLVSILLLWSSLAGASSPPLPVEPGRLRARVACAGFSGQTYALYVPKAYTASRTWPVLYCFDPRGDALRALERFIPGAEAHGYVVAASYNARNADPEGVGPAVEAMLQDTHRALRLDPQRRYAAGFSGGASVACAVAAALDLPGVIAVGGPLRADSVGNQGGFAVYGAAGETDFNYQRMRAVDQALNARGRAHRFMTFPGQHEWLPAELATDALAWFDLLAMREGLRPLDPIAVQRHFQERMRLAGSATDAARRHAAYEAIVADFQRLLDVAEPRGRAAALAATPAVKAQAQAEERAERAEMRWSERLQEAARVARFDLPGPSDRLAAPRLSRWDPAGSGEADADAPGGFGEWPAASAAGVANQDPWVRLERLARQAERAASEQVGARRALNGAFVAHLEIAQELMIEEDYPQAADHLRVAASMYPNSGHAKLLLARAYALQGRVREGREALDRAQAQGVDDRELVAAIEHALAHPVEAVVTLQPFLVSERGTLTTSFGLALTILADPETGLIRQVLVKGVAERSEAEFQGLRPGDEIVAADGVLLDTLRARFDRSSRFHRLFMRRQTGDSVTLRVRSVENGTTRSVQLRQRAQAHVSISYENPVPR